MNVRDGRKRCLIVEPAALEARCRTTKLSLMWDSFRGIPTHTLGVSMATGSKHQSDLRRTSSHSHRLFERNDWRCICVKYGSRLRHLLHMLDIRCQNQPATSQQPASQPWILTIPKVCYYRL